MDASSTFDWRVRKLVGIVAHRHPKWDRARCMTEVRRIPPRRLDQAVMILVKRTMPRST